MPRVQAIVRAVLQQVVIRDVPVTTRVPVRPVVRVGHGPIGIRVAVLVRRLVRGLRLVPGLIDVVAEAPHGQKVVMQLRLPVRVLSPAVRRLQVTVPVPLKRRVTSGIH